VTDEELIRRWYAAPDADALPGLVSPDLRVVTRDGELRGEPALHRLQDEVRSQVEQFREFRQEIEEVRRCPDGAYVVLLRVTRVSDDPAIGTFRAWPAHVLRIRDGRLTFMEGYQNRDKALRDLGLG
jgi:hypothetical protein